MVVHVENKKLEDILKDLLTKAEPYVGPWEIKWKLKKGNMDILRERFSLDAETTFETFASYLSSYVSRYRGFGLSFNLFEAERVLVITD